MHPKMINCPKCNEKLIFRVEESIISNAESFPVPCVVQHNDHYIILYLDSQSAICDVEIAHFFKSE